MSGRKRGQLGIIGKVKSRWKGWMGGWGDGELQLSTWAVKTTQSSDVIPTAGRNLSLCYKPKYLALPSGAERNEESQAME